MKWERQISFQARSSKYLPNLSTRTDAKKKIWPWQSKLYNNVFEKDHYLQYLFSLAFRAASFPFAQDTGSTTELALLSAPFLPSLSHQTVIFYFMVLFFSLSQQKAISHTASKPSHKGATAFQTWPRCDQLYSNIYINYLAHCLHQGNLLFKTYFVLKQDGAEYGSRVASSEKTLQFFVCFISFFVVLRVRCCSYNCLR